jgi:ankyrin repeat protein
LDIVKYLIPKFANKRFESDNYGDTCLLWAAREGHLAVMKYLIGECGLDPVTGNKNGWTALHYASRCGHLHIVRELIEKINVDVFTTKLVWCLLFAYLNTQQSLVPYHDLYTPPYIIPSLYIQTLVLSGIK